MAAPRSGAVIVVEGLDRAGKSTQVARLVAKLESEGHKVQQMRFPGASTCSTFPPQPPNIVPTLPKFAQNLPLICVLFVAGADRSTPIGQTINAYLQNRTQTSDHAIHLLFAANRWEAAASMRAALAAGTSLVVDRYGLSGAVYSAAKDNPALGLDWAWTPEIGLPAPHALVFLSLSPEEAARRGGWGEERYEEAGMQARVRELFRELLKKVKGVGRVVEVDADQVVEAVEREVWDGVKRVFDGDELNKPVGSLVDLDHREG